LSLVLSADLATSAELDQLAAAYLQQATDIAQTATATTEKPSPTPTNAAVAEVSQSIDQADKNQEVVALSAAAAEDEKTENDEIIQENGRE
jgi:hypothetical protein